VHSLGRPDHRLGPADRGLWPWSSAGVRREAVARGAAHPGGAGEPPRWRPPKTGHRWYVSRLRFRDAVPRERAPLVRCASRPAGL